MFHRFCSSCAHCYWHQAAAPGQAVQQDCKEAHVVFSVASGAFRVIRKRTSQLGSHGRAEGHARIQSPCAFRVEPTRRAGADSAGLRHGPVRLRDRAPAARTARRWSAASRRSCSWGRWWPLGDLRARGDPPASSRWKLGPASCRRPASSPPIWGMSRSSGRPACQPTLCALTASDLPSQEEGRAEAPEETREEVNQNP